jgi:hypothetical protein
LLKIIVMHPIIPCKWVRGKPLAAPSLSLQGGKRDEEKLVLTLGLHKHFARSLAHVGNKEVVPPALAGPSEGLFESSAKKS